MTTEPLTDDELALARAERERDHIRAIVPVGWAGHYAWLTYGVTVPHGPVFGYCEHGRVCLVLTKDWVHPYPTVPPACDAPVKTHHVGIA